MSATLSGSSLPSASVLCYQCGQTESEVNRMGVVTNGVLQPAQSGPTPGVLSFLCNGCSGETLHPAEPEAAVT